MCCQRRKEPWSLSPDTELPLTWPQNHTLHSDRHMALWTGLQHCFFFFKFLSPVLDFTPLLANVFGFSDFSDR